MTNRNLENTSIPSDDISSEIKEKDSHLRQAIALRRMRLRGIVGQDEKLRHLTEMLQSEVRADKEIKRFQVVEGEIARAMPAITRMDPKKKAEIIRNFTNQEKNWNTIPPQDIRIDREEVQMWGSFLGTAKKTDFFRVTVLDRLAQGEIALLKIPGFRFFEIVSIRSREKDSNAVSVVRFQRDDMREPMEKDYFISLPLIEGGVLSIINQASMATVATHKILMMVVNKEHKNLIQKLFDIFS